MNNVNELITAMKNGKKIRRVDGVDAISPSYPLIRVIRKDGKVNYIDNDAEYFKGGIIVDSENIESIKVVGSGSGKRLEIDYYYFNPQKNRCLAKLKDGTVADWCPDFIDLIYNKYEIVDDSKETVIEVTMEEVYAKFGSHVKIVDKK